MIKSFRDKVTEKIGADERPKRMEKKIFEAAKLRLFMLDNATVVDDLKLPPSNMLKKLVGDREGQWSIRINNQYRFCFEWNEGDDGPSNVEFCDYH